MSIMYDVQGDISHKFIVYVLSTPFPSKLYPKNKQNQSIGDLI